MAALAVRNLVLILLRSEKIIIVFQQLIHKCMFQHYIFHNIFFGNSESFIHFFFLSLFSIHWQKNIFSNTAPPTHANITQNPPEKKELYCVILFTAIHNHAIQFLMGERKNFLFFFNVVVAAFMFFSFTKFPHPTAPHQNDDDYPSLLMLRREYGVKIERASREKWEENIHKRE